MATTTDQGAARPDSSRPPGATPVTTPAPGVNDPGSTLPPAPESNIVLNLPRMGTVGQILVVTAFYRSVPQSNLPSKIVGTIEWTSSDPTVARFESGDAYQGGNLVSLRIVGEGLVTISARVAGESGSAQLTAVVDPPLDDALEFESFSVIELREFQTIHGTAWEYAPVVPLRNRSDRTLTVSGFRIWIPGHYNIPGCAPRRRIEPGAKIDLFFEAYGDWSKTVVGVGTVPGPATAVVYFIDDAGRTGKIVASAPIVSGPLPSAVPASLGEIGNACNSAFWPPGPPG